MLLLTINRNIWGNHIWGVQWHALLVLTLSGQNQVTHFLKRYTCISQRSLLIKGPILILNINRKPYMGSTMAASHLTLSDLERSKSRSLRFWLVGDLYGIHTYICQVFITPLIWMSQRRSLVVGELSTVPAGSLVDWLFFRFLFDYTALHILVAWRS